MENGDVHVKKDNEQKNYQNNVENLSPKKSKKRKSNIPAEELINNNTECDPVERKKKKNKETVENNSMEPEKFERKEKKKKEKLLIPSENSSSENPQNSNKNMKNNENPENTDKPSVKLSKRQKRNRKNKIKSSEGENAIETKEENSKTPGTFNTEGNEWSSDVKFGNKNNLNKSNDEENPTRNNNKPENNFRSKDSSTNPRQNNFNVPQNRFNQQKIIKKRKPPKIRDDKEHKRRKPNPGSTKVIINGMEVEIVMYDGFPVKKEDADRLKDLRKQMVMKGIPKSEIDVAMKLERRKAEKALTRVKKNVCFHCRKAGHNLSDCPDLGKEEAATGICFKCGSTEHTHFECRVTKKEEFGFAKCFICREQGHIAKQCPDNPKGLYPQGGACKICGDVTHLKKDCPDLMKEKEETTLTLNTIADDTIEALGNEKKKEEINKQKSKVIKF